MKYLAMEQPSTVAASRPADLPLPTGMGRQRTRRSWTVEQKLAILSEVRESGDRVAVVARRHDMNANHLHLWMKQARERRLDDRSEMPVAFIDMGVVGAGPRDAEPEEAALARSPTEPAAISHVARQF
ncbi:transposase [Mesorhizobium atlanticum]|uniref:Transposase n=1 Tax=Mesorhizobium atlanticum TaxID=2233532 RepID=A0A330GHX5_9HYPH|nr:transposase [Mesorhizobium atlanticum]RAZ71142.1 hypothetical protein DPM35_31610 [Mesorhizobium atlanticum]